MTTLILLLLLASPQLGAGNLLTTSLVPVKMIPVTVRIDFGPAGRSLIEKEIKIPEGSTPKQALAKICPTQAGATCCDPAEVKGINGVSVDPMQNRWWRLKINGTTKNASPHKSHLKAGDLMEWVYFEDKQ